MRSPGRTSRRSSRPRPCRAPVTAYSERGRTAPAERTRPVPEAGSRDNHASVNGSGSSMLRDGKVARRVEAFLRRVWSGDFPRPRTLLAHSLIGAAALGTTTAVCFSVGLNPGAVALIYLIVIVMLSLLGDSFVSFRHFLGDRHRLHRLFFRRSHLLVRDRKYERCSDLHRLSIYVSPRHGARQTSSRSRRRASGADRASRAYS